MKLHQQLIYTDGEWIQFHAFMPLAMSWHGWVSFCILQWFGIRLDKNVVVETTGTSRVGDGCVHLDAVARLRFDKVRFAWPLTGWYLSWRREVIVPALFSLPMLLAIGALVWWLT